jgi:exopolysaccharide production protein ExoQ
MSKAFTNASKPGRARSSRSLAAASVIPTLACGFSLIVSPLFIFFTASSTGVPGLMETRYENKIFWPVLAAISIAIAATNFSRQRRVVWPPHIVCLFAYLAFAGASVLWAFAPNLSFIRYLQQLMVVASVLLPAILTVRATDMMRGLFLCFALAAFLNIFFVMQGYQTFADNVAIGYQGYFPFKNYLGECAAIALLLSLHEVLHRGSRRVTGIIIAIISIVLLLFANSKTSVGLALLVPCLAGLVLALRRAMRISPVMLPLFAIFIYLILSSVSGFRMGRISYMLYGDSSFTGRQVIWDFASSMIALKPLSGWGYQSFWLVGPDGPSVAYAPGWVKSMPNAHNGYYDTLLEMGYVGFWLLLAFVSTTLHAIGRVADREPARAWILLSLAFFVIIYNGLESTWMRGFEFEWIVFLFVAAETARHCQPAYRASRPLRPGSRRAPRPARSNSGRRSDPTEGLGVRS